ncbi:MAG: hypothetical protein DCC58_11715 [Chloroflexi bacterium]|nr:MAG: hypothetical protein DCC58_11715 [Chloroflexota bacterium]
MDERPTPTTRTTTEGEPARPSSTRAELYAARMASPEVTRARETRRRAERYATRGITPFGRQPVQRAQRQRRTLVASVAALASLIGGGGAALAGHTVYQIRYGDTLSEIAEAHQTTVAQLAQINDIANPDLIITGDPLIIPSEGTSGEFRAYTIVWGDTLSAIAETYGTTVDALVELNDIDDPDMIVVGDVLLVPAGPGVVITAGEIDGQQTTDDGENGVDPSEMSDHSDVDSVSSDSDAGQADDIANDGEEDGNATDAEEPDVVADEPADDATGEQTDTGDTTAFSIAALHLVTDGETLESIASLYGITTDALLAANEHAAGGITPGMILAIPEGADPGVQPGDVPTVQATTADSTAAAALAAATAYWGGEIPQDETLVALAGSTDAVGTLSLMLERYGYHAGVFDISSGTATLTAQIDAGIPVVLWISDEYGFRAVVAQGHDDTDIMLSDVVDGTTYWLRWDAFTNAWSAGGGAAIAVAPL